MQPLDPRYLPPPPPGAAAPRPASTSTCARLLLGCALGCAGLALVVVVAAGLGVWWMVRPGRQVASSRVVAPDADGSFAVGDLGDDPGVAALVDHFAREALRQQQSSLPPWVRALQQASAGSPSMGVRMLLPANAAISIERGEDGRSAFVAAVNPRGLTRVLHALLESAETAESYGGEEVLRLDGDAWATALGGTFVFSDDEAALHRAIDRLHAGATGPPPAVADLGAPSRSWDITGSVSNREHGVEKLLWSEEVAPAGMVRARLGVDVVGSDLVVGRVLVDCYSPEAASTAAEALQRRAGERAQALAAKGFDLRTAARSDGSTAALEWELHGVERAMSAWMANAQQPPG